MAKGFQSAHRPIHMAVDVQRPTAVMLLALFVLMTLSPMAAGSQTMGDHERMDAALEEALGPPNSTNTFLSLSNSNPRSAPVTEPCWHA